MRLSRRRPERDSVCCFDPRRPGLTGRKRRAYRLYRKWKLPIESWWWRPCPNLTRRGRPGDGRPGRRPAVPGDQAVRRPGRGQQRQPGDRPRRDRVAARLERLGQDHAAAAGRHGHLAHLRRRHRARLRPAGRPGRYPGPQRPAQPRHPAVRRPDRGREPALRLPPVRPRPAPGRARAGAGRAPGRGRGPHGQLLPGHAPAAGPGPLPDARPGADPARRALRRAGQRGPDRGRRPAHDGPGHRPDGDRGQPRGPARAPGGPCGHHGRRPAGRPAAQRARGHGRRRARAVAPS